MSEQFEDLFTVDHARQLSDLIFEINRRRLRDLEKAAELDQVDRGLTSFKMMKIEEEWASEIRIACRQMMAHMSAFVNQSMRIAREITELWPSPRHNLIYTEEGKEPIIITVEEQITAILEYKRALQAKTDFPTHPLPGGCETENRSPKT